MDAKTLSRKLRITRVGILEEHEHSHKDEDMLSVEDARERILGFFKVLDAETKPVLEALGQVLAESILGRFDIPYLDNSAMDGYAINSDSVTGASRTSPVTLQVIGSIAAGQLPRDQVTQGTAVRIMTGAPIPNGANAVVPFEDTDETEHKSSGKKPDKITVYLDVAPNTHIRPAGQDIKKGKNVLEMGTVLGPAEIGVLVSLGYNNVKVIRRPVVAILSTGDELINPTETYQPGKTYDSNSYCLFASVVSAGGVPMMLGIAKDNLNSLGLQLKNGLKSDLLITSAGVSKGDYDIVKDALSQNGKIEFWAVRMRPAKPLAFGILNAPDGKNVPHLGLPGNPVSALVAFEQFGRHAIFKMLGKGNAARPIIKATLEESIYNPDRRRVYARVIVTRRNDVFYAKLTGHQGSNLLTSMARANGLAVCPEDLPVKEAGETVDVQMLDWPDVNS